MYVLGIDVGGSKTVCLLADEVGTVLAEVRGPGANLQAAGELQVEKIVHRAMEDALGRSRRPPAVVCVGIAGSTATTTRASCSSIMHRISRGARIVVVNDALIALVAAAGESPGIVIVAGTGSIAFGRNARGLAARAGGWGHMIGDEGSGYWIGRQALAAAVREVDGRGPHTALTEDVLAHFGVPDAAGLVAHCVQPARCRARTSRHSGRSFSGRETAAMRWPRTSSTAPRTSCRWPRRRWPRASRCAANLSRSCSRAACSESSRRLSRSCGGGWWKVAPRAEVKLLNVEPATGAVALALAELRGGASLPVYIS